MHITKAELNMSKIEANNLFQLFRATETYEHLVKAQRALVRYEAAQIEYGAVMFGEKPCPELKETQERAQQLSAKMCAHWTNEATDTESPKPFSCALPTTNGSVYVQEIREYYHVFMWAHKGGAKDHDAGKHYSKVGALKAAIALTGL